MAYLSEQSSRGTVDSSKRGVNRIEWLMTLIRIDHPIFAFNLMHFSQSQFFKSTVIFSMSKFTKTNRKMQRLAYLWHGDC